MASLDPLPHARSLREHLLALESTGDPAHSNAALEATRTLAVWHRILGRRALREDLEWLAGGLEEVVNPNALLGIAGRLPLQEQIQQDLERALELLTVELARPRLEGLQEALSLLTPAPEELAAPGCRRVFAAALRACDELGEKPSSSKRFRRMQRRARATRIALELHGARAPTWNALDVELSNVALRTALDKYARRLGLSSSDEPEQSNVRRRVRAKALAAAQALWNDRKDKLRAEVERWTSG